MRNLTAVRFEKVMTSGRTRPLVLACEEADEESQDPTEYVVREVSPGTWYRTGANSWNLLRWPSSLPASRNPDLVACHGYPETHHWKSDP